MHTCVWRPAVDVLYLPLAAQHLTFWGRVSHSSWTGLAWLPRALWESTCLCLPVLGLQTGVLEIQTQVLMLNQLVHLSSCWVVYFCGGWLIVVVVVIVCLTQLGLICLKVCSSVLLNNDWLWSMLLSLKKKTKQNILSSIFVIYIWEDLLPNESHLTWNGYYNHGEALQTPDCLERHNIDVR